MVAPPSGSAQDTALVSNTGQSGTTFTRTSRSVPAQGFRAGSHSEGYTLSSIGVVLGSSATADQAAKLRVELWSAATGGGPDSKVVSLTVPSGALSAGTVSFAAPADTTLSANTDYFVVVYTTDATNLRPSVTNSDNEDAGAAAGWSIANRRHFQSSRNEPDDSASWSTSNNAMRIAVYAEEYVPPREDFGISFRSETETTVTVNGDTVIAAAYSVAEGDTVTVELGLPEAQTEAVRFQMVPDYDSVADFYTDYSLGECPMLDPNDDSITDEERAEAANCRFGVGYVIAEIPAGETSFTYEIRTEDDEEAEGDESFTLNIFPMSYNAKRGVVPKAVVTIVDNDMAAEPGVVVTLPDIVVDGVTQTADKVHTTEGSSGSYTIVLASQPESWVRIYPESAMECKVRTKYPAGTQSRGYVEFTPRNWDVPQTVYARAELDDDAADEEVVITHRLEAPFSPRYQRVDRDPVTNEPLAVHPDTKVPVGVDLVTIDPVTVAVADKHLAGVMVVTDLDPEVVEATDLDLIKGSTASNIVYPATDPTPVYGESPDDCYDYDATHTVTVTASSSDPAVAVVSPASFTFGPNADYSPKTFTITAEGTGTATITYTVSGSDPAYGSVSDYTFEVTVPAPPQVNQAPPSSPQEENPVGVVFRPDPKLPGPVTDVELTATSDGLTVSWGAPDTGASPTGYVVHVKPMDGTKGKIKRPKAKKTEVTFGGLEPGQSYQVSVRAKNSHGKGPRTYTTTITLPRT
ncbi:choice-of-anchor R domain-containing protein [Candidatus Poriferisocius sp.]|uniref:choice-of-anchor R domain-containing protein n=1 Tax=Candidatus Poriferisocius sp. TaxID=3101276 RepID=UPI003B02992F